MSENLTKGSELNLEDISKVANVEVTLCAELGKAQLSLKDVIEYDKGSVVQLDKFMNEPVNVYVNDILIAKAEIVAIENSYGIKIVEILDENAMKTTKNGKINQI